MSNSNKRRLCMLASLVLLGLLALLVCLLPGAPGVSVLRLTHHLIKRPRAFGVLHLSFLALGIPLFVWVSCLGAKKGRERTDHTVFAFGIAFFFLELYKQLYVTFVLCEGRYDFGFFPFQFCSLPLYLCLSVPFWKEGKWKEACYRFLALYGTMGGCLVLAYPAWFDSLALCLHTMVWHIAMISLGLWILFSRGYGSRYREELLPATAVFLGAVTVATLLNVLLHSAAANSKSPLNLFYMSPYESTYFLVIRDVWQAHGWLAAMVCYLFLFIFVGASLVWLLAFLIRRLQAHFSKKR